ncbi:MAG: aspartate-alanine antiporter [Ignavibacteriaceae bacterium]|nr:aspartate-alanine antiporter [Ignavibacteriaceae bacterium]MEB2296476.1 aspartate-alanine antiporter [Ignavibacteria bacterium]
MNEFVKILQQHPELALFLTLAFGFAIGKIRIGNFKVGSVLGTLFAGVLIGQFDIQIHPTVKVIFFDLFLFATGYKVGPQFFRGLKKDAVPQLILTVVICVTCLLTAFIMSKLMGFDVGTAAGLLAGAFTESTVIGTASESIQRLPITLEQKTILLNNIPVAYAVTYLVGTTILVWFLSSLAPKLMKINLRTESRELEKKLLGKSEEEDDGIASAFEDWRLRAFKITNEKWSGLSIDDLEKSITGFRIFIHRIRRNGIIIEPIGNTILKSGDVIAVMARYQVFFQKINDIGTEIMDRELLDFPILYRDLIVTNKNLIGKSLSDIAMKYGQGVKLHKLIRTGQEIPFSPETIVNRGDVLKISGLREEVDRATKIIGYLDSNSPATDMIFVGLGIVIGGLVGLISITIAGISITLTTSGGALVMGLIFGWLRSKTPKFGRIPEPALWIFDTVGLAAFIGIIGLSAGPSFISGLHKTGIGLLFAGVIVAVVPHIFGLLVGRFILKINPVILLGAQSGAGTMTAALKAVQENANSKLPVLGYTVPYALGNILLTAWGPVIVALMNL